MSIADELRNELKDAMRARDRARLDVIRAIETEVARMRSAPGFSGEVDDDAYVGVIGSYVKKMEKAREEFEAAGDAGRANADKLGFEIDYLARWLPETIDEDETRRIVREAITELGVDDPSAAGQVIGRVMKSGIDGLDGALVNRVVREELDS
ncbi:MAG: GatB/YqeY domain-containing protein [Acidimicrobiia bacterium]|nr:GatB/YqeY domain-containing protein [Acidimicrobiia bacterium]